MKTTVEELNKEIADKNMTEEQMRTTIVTQEELVDKLTMVMITVDPQINAIILLMRKMRVSDILINNMTHLFRIWFEQYFFTIRYILMILL